MKLYRVLRVRKRNNNVLNYFCTHNGLFEGGGNLYWMVFIAAFSMLSRDPTTEKENYVLDVVTASMCS